jgi:hypothetical protein
VGFEVMYMDSENDSVFLTVHDSELIVMPYRVPVGFEYTAIVVAHDFSSEVDIDVMVDD